MHTILDLNDSALYIDHRTFILAMKVTHIAAMVELKTQDVTHAFDGTSHPSLKCNRPATLHGHIYVLNICTAWDRPSVD